MNVLITGAASGIALLVAKRVSLNNKVYLGVHTEAQLKEVKKNIYLYKNIKPIKLDVTDEKDIKRIKRYKIDCIYLHAGIGVGGSILDVPIEKIRENYEVNVFGHLTLLKTVVGKMVDSGYGRIIIMSSLMGIMPMRFFGIYASTKSALISLAISLKKELKLINKNIKVCLIEPGAYRTGFNDVMIENKYDYMEKSKYFKGKIPQIRKSEERIFNLIEKRNLTSIVEKIEDAITSEKPRFIYRAPIFQVIFIKLAYFLFY